MLILMLVTIVILYYFIIKKKETFLIETVKEGKDRLTNRLPINETTDKFVKDVSVDTGKDTSGYAFFNRHKIYPKNGKKTGDQDILAYNDDIKYENKILKSKNIEIDKMIIALLKDMENVLVDDNLPAIDRDLPIQEENTIENVQHIDSSEVEYIVQKFINYLNGLTNYSFTSLEIGKGVLDISNTDNSIIKKFNVSFFIYENTITYTKRLKVDFKTTQFLDNTKGLVVVENVVIPKDATLESKPLLPPAREPVKLNTISGYDDYYKIQNKLGLTLPYKTNEIDTIITKKDVLIEAQRRRKVQKLRKEYSCFGIPQSGAIDSQGECLNFGGVWDRPVQDSTMCPFYNSNKNYLNNRGGTKGDYCEMPSGVQIIGYSHYDQDPKKFKPLCYNCKSDLIGQGQTLGHCCQKQKTDKSKYPLIKTPDYKFPGDQLDRYNSKTQLKKLGLSVD